MGTVIRRILLVVTLALAAISPRLAAAVSVVAGVDENRPFVGQAIELRIVVEGDEEPSSFELPPIDGFEIVSPEPEVSTMQRTFSVNGRVTRDTQVTLRWRLVPTRAGPIEIPPIRVPVGAAEHVTSSVGVLVQPPVRSDEFALLIESNNPTPYVGEAVRVRLTWCLSKDARDVQFRLPDTGRLLDVWDAPDRNITNADIQEGRATVVEVQGRRTVGRVGTASIAGRPMTTVTVELIVIPRSAGEIPLGPATAAFDVVQGRRAARDPFDTFFGSRDQTHRLVIASDPASIRVQPLPADPPAGFSGLVGDYRVDAVAEPVEVNVGDPIELRVRVNGPEPIESVQAPVLARQPNFDELYRTPSEPSGTTRAPGRAEFTYSIRARTDSATMIPPVGMWVFDPVRAEYRRAESRAIPIVVRPTRQVGLAQAEGAAPQTAAPAPIEQTQGGLRANVEGPALLRDDSFRLAEAARSPIWLAVMLAPPALAVGAALVRISRRRGPARGGLRAALATIGAAHDADPASAAERVSRAVRVYIAERFASSNGHGPASLSTDECVRALREAGAPGADDCLDLLTRADAARFGAMDQADAASFRRDAESLLRTIDAAGGRSS